MGALAGSFTHGRGNMIGCMGEILVHQHIGGLRVGAEHYSHDIVLPSGLTVDVKTTQGAAEPLPHYVARVYGGESDWLKLASKCDVYYFVRCNVQLTKAWLVGWLPAAEFIKKATFQPKGCVDPDDGKVAYRDEYTVPIALLRSPAEPLSL